MGYVPLSKKGNDVSDVVDLDKGVVDILVYRAFVPKSRMRLISQYSDGQNGRVQANPPGHPPPFRKAKTHLMPSVGRDPAKGQDVNFIPFNFTVRDRMSLVVSCLTERSELGHVSWSNHLEGKKLSYKEAHRASFCRKQAGQGHVSAKVHRFEARP